MLRFEKSSSVAKSLTDFRVMTDVVFVHFEKTQQSDAKRGKKTETLVRSSYTG